MDITDVYVYSLPHAVASQTNNYSKIDSSETIYEIL